MKISQEEYRAKKMKVYIIRHFKVKHTWKKNCTSAEFDEDCRLYDTAPIEIMRNFAEYKAEKVYISTLERSFITARAIFGKRDFCKSNLIHEVPLKSAFDSNRRFPLGLWYFLGRMQWLCNNKRQPESRLETKRRAATFVRKLPVRDGDIAVVTHGFFMRTLISQMKKYGFRVVKNRIFYRNGDVVILVR